jgi:hypothetical protein
MQQLSLLEPRLKEELQIIGERFRKGGLNSWIVARHALETNIVQSLGMTDGFARRRDGRNNLTRVARLVLSALPIVDETMGAPLSRRSPMSRSEDVGVESRCWLLRDRSPDG